VLPSAPGSVAPTHWAVSPARAELEGHVSDSAVGRPERVTATVLGPVRAIPPGRYRPRYSLMMESMGCNDVAAPDWSTWHV
jgi:hypothetical protein